jgi:hypothetical protein
MNLELFDWDTVNTLYLCSPKEINKKDVNTKHDDNSVC